MGRITISLPDPLETELDAYAQEKNLTVSAVVAQALQSLLHPAPPIPPAPDPSPTPPTGDLIATQRYLAELIGPLDTVRQFLHQFVFSIYGPYYPIPPDLQQPLPSPPWAVRTQPPPQEPI